MNNEVPGDAGYDHRKFEKKPMNKLSDRERIAEIIQEENGWVRPLSCADAIFKAIKELGYYRIDLDKLKGLSSKEIGDCLDLEKEAKYPCSDGGSVWTVSVDKLLEKFLSSVKEQLKSQESSQSRGRE